MRFQKPSLAAFALALAACSGSAAPAADPPETLGVSAAAITGSTVIANGEEWVAAELHYCQAAYGAVDDDSSCWAWEGSSHICDRESNSAWNAYRSDCSGFVTWAWGLPPVGDGGYVTSDFAPFGTSFSTVIQASDLQPGDACNLTAGGHIVLFKEWTTVGSEATFLEEPGCDSTIPYAHEFTSAVTISGSSITIAYEGEAFTAIRYNGLTTAAPDYAATYVSQSWPLATTPLTMTAGQVLPASITLKNTGSKSWDSSTKLATTEPRDRTSVFYGADWLAPNRLAGLPAGTTVAPGDTYEFKFSFYAPSTPGTYDEFFGVVEDGVAWFSDAGQGGPADNVIEARIEVVAGEGSSSAATGAGGASSSSAGAGGAGHEGAGGSATTGSSTGAGGGTGESGLGSGSGSGSRGNTSSARSTCAYRPEGSSEGGAWVVALGLAIAAARRRKGSGVAR